MIPVREQARGRWRTILPIMGISANFLTGKHGPCPMCEGKDRFRFDDKDGAGTWFCSKCGAGDGVKLVMLSCRLDFKEAAKAIEKHVGTAPALPPKPALEPGQVLRQMNAIWQDGKPLADVSAAAAWWADRVGHIPASPDLRAIVKLKYQDGLDGPSSWHPAIVARVRDPDGTPVNMHRTYLSPEGGKADVPRPRKLMAATLPKGSAVRLARYTDTLGIAEGIETARAATVLTGTPCWAAINATNMEGWSPPDGVRSVVVFGDCDSSMTGQSAAFTLAKRLRVAGLSVDVRLPQTEDTDWNDVLRNQRGAA